MQHTVIVFTQYDKIFFNVISSDGLIIMKEKPVFYNQ